MRQENHSMKAAYPFYLCLLSLKYSLTSESPIHPFMLCTFEAGDFMLCTLKVGDLLDSVKMDLCDMVVVIADKIPHIIGIFSKDARIYDLIRLA